MFPDAKKASALFPPDGTACDFTGKRQENFHRRFCPSKRTCRKNFSAVFPLEGCFAVFQGVCLFGTMDKSSCRRYYSAIRSQLGSGLRRIYDRRIRDFIRELPEFSAVPGVAAFVPLKGEADLLELSAGKPLFLPRFDAADGGYGMVEVRDLSADLVPGRYNIPEPRPELPPATPDVCKNLLYLIPAVACDRRGTRLGRGGGWYDRILAGVSYRAAVIYSCQLAETPLPVEPHDVPMWRIVTENGVITPESIYNAV